MANFNTHLNVAVLLTGISSASLVAAGHIELNAAIWLWFLGTIGGLLPDIDSDNSTSLDTIFNIFSFATILIIMRYITSHNVGDLSLVKVITIPVLVYSFMKHVLRSLFERMTVHRGSCHSLLFLALSGLVTTQVISSADSTNTDHADMIAWLSGGFIFLGGLIHLILDEVYSVDLRNIKIKHSFGTALKIASLDSKLLTLSFILATSALCITTPKIEYTLEKLSNWSMFILF